MVSNCNHQKLIYVFQNKLYIDIQLFILCKHLREVFLYAGICIMFRVDDKFA
jgi:hypothetical protein